MSVLHQLSLLIALVLCFARSTDQQPYKILGALTIGSSQDDIDRFSKALIHFETNFTGTVNWALFHYQDIDVWKSQPWYNNSNIVLSINELEFAFYYFYKYLTIEYITNLNEYDWIWLMVSDCDFEVFDAQTFVDLLDLWKPGVAQPANTGYSPWPHTPLHRPSNMRVTNLVEIGPLLSIRLKLWEPVRRLMNPNFNSGWGVDNILCTWISKNYGYTLNPYNKTSGSAMPSARVWLSTYNSYDYSGRKRRFLRAKHPICPHPWSFTPACLIVDASPLKHLDFHEGKKSGLYNNHAFKELNWYRRKYGKYFVAWRKAFSYCTS